MSNKALVMMISGMVTLLFALPCLYWGLCAAVKFNNMVYMPLPCMVCIVAAGVLFHKAERAL